LETRWLHKLVMPGLVPGIHVFVTAVRTWMAGTSPTMTPEMHLASPPLDEPAPTAYL